MLKWNYLNYMTVCLFFHSRVRSPWKSSFCTWLTEDAVGWWCSGLFLSHEQCYMHPDKHNTQHKKFHLFSKCSEASYTDCRRRKKIKTTSVLMPLLLCKTARSYPTPAHCFLGYLYELHSHPTVEKSDLKHLGRSKADLWTHVSKRTSKPSAP